MRSLLSLLSALALVLAVACCSAQPTVGAVPLRDADHMRGHLTHAPAWRAILDDGAEMFWTFAEDGTCRTWIEGEGRADLHYALTRIAPEGSRRMQANWSADTERLTLTGVTTGDGELLRDMGFPLGWVDGKLRIEIDGRRYMRQPKKP